MVPSATTGTFTSTARDSQSASRAVNKLRSRPSATTGCGTSLVSKGWCSRARLVAVLGVLHHAWLVQVTEAAAEQVAVDDTHHRLDDLHYLVGDAGPFETIEVPGFPGRYALVIAPGVR